MRNLKNILVVTVLVMSLVLATAACGNQSSGQGGTTQTASTAEEKKFSGEIKVDGSSTVFPITEAVAEEFNKLHPDVKVPVGVAGTGGGMKKFAAGEIEIADASRPIKDSEKEEAAKNGIEFVEFMVAYDGISVVVNKDNTWLDSITVAELKKIWQKDSTVKNWNEVNPAWPAEPIKLYGPGTDSGTFEFFTEKINGVAKESRTDYTPSEDDNVLVQGVAGDKNAMGYFGYAYYEENKDTLKVLKIDAGKGPLEPSIASIKDLSYQPLSRPLYIYVNKKALEQDYVKAFVEFYLTNAPTLVAEADYVPLNDYSGELAKLK